MVGWTGDERLRPLVAAAERQSNHPAAAALAAGFEPDRSTGATDVVQHPGRGLTARVGGRELLVGSPAFAADRLGSLPAAVEAAVSGVIADGLTPVVVAVDGSAEAVAALGDPIRPDTPEALSAIRDRGWRIEILSGDHPGTVRAVLGALDLAPEAGRGGALPEDKVRRVEAVAADGPVVMVGDGVNDAAALAAATVGISVHVGAEATLAAADVYLAEPGLGPLVRLLDGSRKTLGVIRRNLAFSLAYNAVAVTLAMTGHMHPLVAAILMPASSITVVVSSYRSRTFE